MSTKENTQGTNRKTAITVAVLFIISSVAGFLSYIVILAPILQVPDFLSNVSANANQVVMGMLLDLICAGAFVALAVVLYPILKKYSESIALGYVVARTLEAVPFVLGAISLLSLITLGQEYVQASAPDASFQTLGNSLLAVRDWNDLLGARIFASLAALPFYFLLFQTRLLPRWISVWGLIGAPLYFASGLLPMFGLDPLSPLLIVLFLPAAVLEMVLAVRLIIKGFNSPSIASRSAK
ncbi:MAG: DUF4386 domain-containing protein [Anaerolineaceae bacterium]|nr:DUF4386 domain-containing protein [Anaerolineaceae bacterium]